VSGANRVVVETNKPVPLTTWGEEQESYTDAWPYVSPTFLYATEQADTDLKACHTVARRGRGEIALLPGYVIEDPPAVDHDPRTYLGWRAPSGEQVCCGVSVGDAATEEVNSWGTDALFPCLLLGSPLGYRTEVAYNFWSKALFAQMINAAVSAAVDAGIRSVAAPWVPERAGNTELIAALNLQGAATAFWGYEDFVSLHADSWKDHLASLPTKIRQRINSDTRKAVAAGAHITRVTGPDLLPHLATIAGLACLNREKNGASEDPIRVERILRCLLDAGADLRGYLIELDGRVVGSCVALRKQHTLFPKWAGFDYARIGDRSGLYFAGVLNAPVEDAYAEGLHMVEFGAGAHQAKLLRGCRPRAIHSAVLLADPCHRAAADRLMADFGSARHSAFGDRTLPAPLPLATGTTGCCSAG
jgi:hypothetical protein